jgi:GNAT superfamily N-acetyltransferase
VRFVLTTDPNLHRLLNGYVWIEEGRVVGNVSLQSSLHYGGRWYVSNVAVAPKFRGRGVARSLMEAALQQVRQRGGGWTLLQAEESNLAAMKLYRRMGFSPLGSTAHLYLPASPDEQPAPMALTRCRPWRTSDWRAEYELAKAATPSLLQWWAPLRSASFRVEAEDRLGEWIEKTLGRRQTYRWVVPMEGDRSERLAASLRLRAARRKDEHTLRLFVHPDARGELEEPLIQQAMAVLASCPVRPVTARHPSEHTEAMQVFRAHGFQMRRNLVSMRKRI